MTFAAMVMTVGLVLAAAGDPPPPAPPAALVVHGLAYFRSGADKRIRPPDFDPIAHLVGRMPADAYPFIRAQADTVGDAQANHDLSLRRARSVADEVVALGASPDRITLFACGEQALAAPTPDNTPEPANRVAEFSWGSAAPGTPPPGCTMHPYRPGSALSAPKAILSRAAAEAMGASELARRLFPDLAPENAFHKRVAASSRFGGQGLTEVSVYTRPVNLGDGLCGAIRHSFETSQPSDYASAKADTPVTLDRRKAWVTLFMRPTLGPDVAKSCAEHNPERFYAVRPVGVSLDRPYPQTVSKLLRRAAVNGARVPIECVDHTAARACDDPQAALEALELDRVVSISRGAGPDARCPGGDAAAGCWRYTTELYGPICGAWIVTVSARDGRMTGLRMRRECIAFH